ncbi:hypothetical protein A6V39_00835 [Candidatus Mycoplasma haematobovis]|uniref:Uncharacterized protein n=1 Tax=Candidatus Mycoplasma haematobovis TaxID=432608 RepID=A0A1A9QDP6_9MOLU|nr:hypothetical protein [Candidatus Mycoplasma haematobovis]OAL10597.1 hypothetical protein A6V39_00835 [Candidatus Mycoplasma haematobovis]
MALNTIGKVAIGAACTGIAGSTGVGCYFLFKQPTPITISKLIEQEHKGKEILSSTNKSKGVQAWTNYKNNALNKNKPKDQDAWSITGWPVTEPRAGTTVSEAPDGLVAACQSKKTTKVKDNQDPTYKNFVDWCLVNKG